MCRVTILDGNGIPITVEVSQEIYQVFVDYEREVERQRKADSRHRDARSWDTCLIFEVSSLWEMNGAVLQICLLI